MYRGYIKVWRKMMDNFISTNPHALSLWVHLLMDCNHEDKEFLFNGQKQICKRGQTITGLYKLSEITGMNTSKIQRLLKMLENEKLIDKQSNNRFSLITVINYDKYQSGDKQNDKPMINQRLTSDNKQTLISTNKNEYIYNSNDIQEIITYFNVRLNTKYNPNARSAEFNSFEYCVKKVLETYSLDQIKQAVDNFVKNPWRKEKKITHWAMLFKDDATIEKYLSDNIPKNRFGD